MTKLCFQSISCDIFSQVTSDLGVLPVRKGGGSRLGTKYFVVLLLLLLLLLLFVCCLLLLLLLSLSFLFNAISNLKQKSFRQGGV